MASNNNLQMVILASRSPRRVALLKQLGIDCIVLPADIDESRQPAELPVEYVKRLAKQKAKATAENRKDEYQSMMVLAADTTVALGDEIYGKPESDAHAVKMLKALSSSVHQVHTAVAISYGSKTQVKLSSTQVEMCRLTNDMIAQYISYGEHRDKAGSYGIQGRAAAWIKHIEGSYSGVMGLPLYETMQLINRMRVQ